MGYFSDERDDYLDVYMELLEKLMDGDMSDLTITCGSESFLIYKAIVCNRSQFFKATCVNNTTESLTSVIDLPEDDPIIVEKMINFLYLGNYSSQYSFGHWHSSDSKKTAESIAAKASIQMGLDFTQGVLHDGAIHVKVKSIAKKYVLPGLAASADSNFLRCLEDGLETDDFWACASLVYSSTELSDAELRGHVVSFLGKHLHETEEEQESLKTALREIPELPIDFACYKLRRPVPESPVPNRFRGTAPSSPSYVRSF